MFFQNSGCCRYGKLTGRIQCLFGPPDQWSGKNRPPGPMVRKEPSPPDHLRCYLPLTVSYTKSATLIAAETTPTTQAATAMLQRPPFTCSISLMLSSFIPALDGFHLRAVRIKRKAFFRAIIVVAGVTVP